jgi:hypothetical protein
MRYEVDETGEKQLVEVTARIASARSRRHC